jgi:hypothetical protein
MTHCLRALVLSIALLFAGCQLTDYTLARRSAIDKEIAAARADTTAHLQVLNDQQLSLLRQSIAEHEAREQGAADYLFKGTVTFGTLRAPISRADMVMGQSIQQTAAQLPAASAAAQVKTLHDLQTELDETKVSTETLRAQYEAQLTQARAEGVAKDKALTDIATSLKHVDDERVAVLTKAKDTEAQLSDKRKEVDDAAIAAKDKALAEAESVKAIKTKLSAVAGGLGLLFLLGAIYSPVFKDKLGLAAGVLMLAAVAIWYVQGWMVAVAVGLGLVALVGWAAKNHYIESKAATATYQAIQSIKDTAIADYDKVVKPALAVYHTQYLKDGTTVPDPSISAHIDSVLMATGSK